MLASVEDQDEESGGERGGRGAPRRRYRPIRPSPSPCRLHNFSFPSLSWGARRLFRCVNKDRITPPLPSGSVVYRDQSCFPTPPSPIATAPNINNSLIIPPHNKDDDEVGKESPMLMPWNLRTRRAGCKNPAATEEASRRKRFSLEISKDEMEEDFLLLKGTRPPRRPRKRPRSIQKQLDMLFPGLILMEIIPELYS